MKGDAGNFLCVSGKGRRVFINAPIPKDNGFVCGNRRDVIPFDAEGEIRNFPGMFFVWGDHGFLGDTPDLYFIETVYPGDILIGGVKSQGDNSTARLVDFL